MVLSKMFSDPNLTRLPIKSVEDVMICVRFFPKEALESSNSRTVPCKAGVDSGLSFMMFVFALWYSQVAIFSPSLWLRRTDVYDWEYEWESFWGLIVLSFILPRLGSRLQKLVTATYCHFRIILPTCRR